MDLDRMAIEEAGRRPEAMASEIHRQLGQTRGAIDVSTIALKLDILEVRTEPLTNIEGALLTQPERTTGIILCNAKSSPRRRRFTVAHELLHFLNDKHIQTDAGFTCRTDDVRIIFDAPPPGATQHARQEAEANRFAIELLAPVVRVRRFISDDADLDAVLALADDLALSREAAVRRYVERHPGEIAIGFIRAGRLRYWARSRDCPPLVSRAGQQMASLPLAGADTGLSAFEETDPDPADWVVSPDGGDVSVQVLHQRDDHAMVLVVISPGDDEADENLVDHVPRFR